ncbi:hypothetical protein ACSBR1_012503 [Camellia fascicularis]
MIWQSSHNSQGHSSQGGENQPAAAKATVGHSDKAEQPQQPVATKATTVKAIAANCNQGHREDLLAIEADQPFKFPATFTFVVRAFSVLDGIGKGLDPHFDITEIAKPIHMAPFNDEYLYVEIANEVTLKFYGLGLGMLLPQRTALAFPLQLLTVAHSKLPNLKIRYKLILMHSYRQTTIASWPHKCPTEHLAC